LKHYIVDGNNLIGKIHFIKKLQRSDRQASRVKVSFLLGRYFNKRKASVSLHFDGHPGESIIVSGIKIKYSENRTADDRIKKEIERSKNPKNIIVVTSDNNVAEFAKVCSCQVIKCEDFSKKLLSSSSADEEKMRIDELNDPEEFKRLFGA
jgi:predicted RNA-binding protein with PIN domain